MRARNIKPGFFKNEILGLGDPFLGLTFQGLWCLADRDGRLEYRPLRIKAEIFPYRYDLEIEQYLIELEANEFIEFYEVGKKKYIQILNFLKHQSPHHTEKRSDLPAKPVFCASENLTVNSRKSNGGNPPDLLIPDSLITDSHNTDSHTLGFSQAGSIKPERVDKSKRFKTDSQNDSVQKPDKRVNEKQHELKNDINDYVDECVRAFERKVEDIPDFCGQPEYPADFMRFFRAWPNTNDSIRRAYQAWVRAEDRPNISTLIFMIERLKRTDRWRRNVIPHPSTWLDDRRWETCDDSMLSSSGSQYGRYGYNEPSGDLPLWTES